MAHEQLFGKAAGPGGGPPSTCAAPGAAFRPRARFLVYKLVSKRLALLHFNRRFLTKLRETTPSRRTSMCHSRFILELQTLTALCCRGTSAVASGDQSGALKCFQFRKLFQV